MRTVDDEQRGTTPCILMELVRPAATSTSRDRPASATVRLAATARLEPRSAPSLRVGGDDEARAACWSRNAVVRGSGRRRLLPAQRLPAAAGRDDEAHPHEGAGRCEERRARGGRVSALTAPVRVANVVDEADLHHGGPCSAQLARGPRPRPGVRTAGRRPTGTTRPLPAERRCSASLNRRASPSGERDRPRRAARRPRAWPGST